MLSRQLPGVLALHTDLASVMNDSWFDDGRSRGLELRQFVIAYLWSRAEGCDKNEIWQRTKTFTGYNDPRTGNFRLWDLYRADVPRYEPSAHTGVDKCPVTLLVGPRAGQTCNRRGVQRTRHTDPATGQWHFVHYCPRHHEAALAMQRRDHFQVGHKVEPPPNTGGLLPCYIRSSSWPELYAQALPGWSAPTLGVIADDWPGLAHVSATVTTPKTQTHLAWSEARVPALIEHARPRLALVSN